MLEPVAVKIIPDLSFLIDEITPHLLNHLCLEFIFRQTLTMRASSNHVEKTCDAVQGITDYHNAFVGLKSRMTNALWKMGFNNPHTIVNLALSYHPHFVKLFIQRSPKITV